MIFSFGEIQPDWGRLTPYVMDAISRLVPSLRDSVGIRNLFGGPESFTPDNYIPHFRMSVPLVY